MEGQASSGTRASSSSPQVSTLLAHVHPSDCPPGPCHAHLPLKQVSTGVPFSLLPSPFDSPRTPSPAEMPKEAPSLGTEQPEGNTGSLQVLGPSTGAGTEQGPLTSLRQPPLAFTWWGCAHAHLAVGETEAQRAAEPPGGSRGRELPAWETQGLQPPTCRPPEGHPCKAQLRRG